MTNEEAFEIIQKALEEVEADSSKDVTTDTDLAEDEILDSLDLVSFLYELEVLVGKKIEAITEDYDDFKVSSLVKLVVEA